MVNLMEPKTIDVLGGAMSYISTEIDFGRETLLFVHGLGGSNLSFLEAFQEPALQSYNLIAPDLLGFGRSSDATEGGYSLSAQVTRLVQFLEKLGLKQCHLVGHSMGGDVGVFLCLRKPDLVSSFVNIEGDLTSGDRFITNQAMEAIHGDWFPKWFKIDFREVVMKWAQERESCRKYLSALSNCREEAFLEAVMAIYDLNNQPENLESIIGNRYRLLPLPKIYCWGMDTLSQRSQKYLGDIGLYEKAFEDSGHWVMQDRQDVFYNFLAGFLASHRTTIS